jgi:hypothetical protein
MLELDLRGSNCLHGPLTKRKEKEELFTLYPQNLPLMSETLVLTASHMKKAVLDWGGWLGFSRKSLGTTDGSDEKRKEIVIKVKSDHHYHYQKQQQQQQQ